MSLRRPAAHLRRTPSWRRSGDESDWESLISEGDVLPPVTRPTRAPRPQSAVEGVQLDMWLEQLQRMQSDLLDDQVPAFNDRTTSMPGLNKQPGGRAWRRQEIPSFSGGSSSCGSPSLCESSLGSQESLQTGFFSPPEHRESWERAHLMQAPRKEQAQLSYVAPVKIGWLPIQRKVMMAADNCMFDHSAVQVKLKQPITPTFQTNRGTASRHQDGEVERSHTSSSTLGVRTWQTPDQGSPITKQVPGKQSSAANEVDRPGGWQALRRGWNTNRLSTLPGGSQSNELPTGTCSDSYRKSPLMKTTGVEPLKHIPLQRTTSTDPCRQPLLPQGTNSTETYKSHAPLHRTSSVQPLRPKAPLFRTNSSSHTQTSSAVTTLVPQSKAGISSITISSRKVSRSVSLPGSDIPSYSHSATKSRESPSVPQSHPSIDPNSRQVTVQRKATIVKVTEQRMMSSPNLSTKRAGTPPTSQDLDTVVHRRKATIIKVTEHRESYSPARTRHPEYRHSYTEGVYKENSVWSPGNHSEHDTAPSYHHLDSTERPYSAVTPNASTSDPLKDGGTLHKSTLRLFVSNQPAIAAPLELSPDVVGQRSGRPHRPLSCYGNVFGHTEPSKENMTQPGARKRSFELPQETSINPVNSHSSFPRPGVAVNEAGQRVGDTLKTNRGERERLPPSEDAARRTSPCLTLIKAPDPHSHQSPEDVLALNAAAIIANIKLHRQLSKKKTPNGNSEKDSTASPQGNTVTDEGKRKKPHPDQSRVQHHYPPHAGFVPLSLDPERSAETISLQEALQRSRPDFISRSQGRVRELERRAQERRDSLSDAALRQGRARSAWSTSLIDNLFKHRDRAITGRETELRSKHTLADVKRKREEEKKQREVCLSNRQRAEIFRKKLLDQILQRSNN